MEDDPMIQEIYVKIVAEKEILEKSHKNLIDEHATLQKTFVCNF